MFTIGCGDVRRHDFLLTPCIIFMRAETALICGLTAYR
jgi:hypothetical protein